MSAPDDDDEAVGYGKPPKATRFRKGKSGNPKGRPRGSRNLASMVHAAVMETVMVNAKGRRRAITKLEAALTQQANKAASGDAKATKMLTDLFLAAEGRDQASGQGQIDPKDRRENDALIMKAIAARLKGKPDE